MSELHHGVSGGNNYDNPQAVLGLLPHQIMNCARIGSDGNGNGVPMMWNCVTCYQCQEHCPQNVKVTDILYQLKNLAVENARRPSEDDTAVSEAV